MSEQGAVERWLAWRYLATRQREGFVSFLAIFSLIGIALGVATLLFSKDPSQTARAKISKTFIRAEIT